ncbi:MFS transporter [Streptomyces sp. NPDC091281]|uniref:MFS transporter n=1 Tax=Streptomyces sp. NPDC091281 TaxID=3365985 RepID=UPI0037F8872D
MRARLRHTFRSLAVRNFRLFAIGQVLSVSGTWMMVVAQDWLVLSLTDDSATALGAVTAAQFTPVLLLTLYGGRLADRHDKRRLLILCNSVSGGCALVLALLDLGGALKLWHVFAFALCLGTVNAVEVPTRMSFVSEMVGPDLLPNASSLSAVYFNLARVLGPAAAGALIAASGTGTVMALNAASYPAVVAGLCMMRTAELTRAPRDATARLTDGLRHLAARPDLVAPMALVLFVGLFGMNFHLTLPLLAKTVFHADAASFGLLTTAFAAGSLLGGLAGTARRGRPSARTVTGAALAFCALETATGWAPTFAVAAVLLTATGFATIYFAQAANHRIQLGSDPRYRGRVLAVYTLVMQGTTPLGGLLVGWLSARLGARSGLYTGGLASLAATLAVMAVVRLRERRAAPAEATSAKAEPPSATAEPPSAKAPEAFRADRQPGAVQPADAPD